jgi:hypothetical protein
MYAKPKDQIQKNHNKEALKLLEVKKSQATIEQQAIGSAFIPAHKFKANFLEYYEGYVKLNIRKGNRHLVNSLAQFKLFIKKDFISPIEITENFCKRFRQFLLDKYTGETPGNYYSRFKWAGKAAKSDGYFQSSLTDNFVQYKKKYKTWQDYSPSIYYVNQPSSIYKKFKNSFWTNRFNTLTLSTCQEQRNLITNRNSPKPETSSGKKDIMPPPCRTSWIRCS